MRIGFVINRIATEKPVNTTVRLAMEAANRGHEAWLIGVGDFVYDPDGSVNALGIGPCPEGHDDTVEFFTTLVGEEGNGRPSPELERICVDELDVLMLRNDPAEDAEDRPWAQTSGILFGQLAAVRGVIVLNDPEHLADAINKTYFQHFPEAVRPATCISREEREIKRFIEEQEGRAVIKPLQGSGGQGVFLVRPDDRANLNQMIEAVTRDGYAIVQEYLPEAADGDIRLFLVNGRPLEVDGVHCAFRRRNETGDARSNISAGAGFEPVEIGDTELRIAEIVRPKLVRDGMYLVGLDIVGDRLMEINVFSPGGMGAAQMVHDVNFADALIQDLERKVELAAHYGSLLDNVQRATL